MSQVVQIVTRLVLQDTGNIEYHIAQAGTNAMSDIVTVGVRNGVRLDESMFLEGLALIKAAVEKAQFNSPGE